MRTKTDDLLKIWAPLEHGLADRHREDFKGFTSALLKAAKRYEDERLRLYGGQGVNSAGQVVTLSLGDRFLTAEGKHEHLVNAASVLRDDLTPLRDRANKTRETAERLRTELEVRDRNDLAAAAGTLPGLENRPDTRDLRRSVVEQLTSSVDPVYRKTAYRNAPPAGQWAIENAAPELTPEGDWKPLIDPVDVAQVRADRIRAKYPKELQAAEETAALAEALTFAVNSVERALDADVGRAEQEVVLIEGRR
jgi:hypothetical protein